MSKQDDVSTIVLDFGKLKSKLNEQEDILLDGNDIPELSFSTDLENNKESNTALHKISPKRKIFLIEYKTHFFDQHRVLFSELSNCESVNDLPTLNKAITEFPNALFIMYFNDTPKAINQISEQLKRKFENADSIIIAKNLSSAKAKQHKASKYGASAYLNDPFNEKEFERILKTFLENE